jgi:hypothetical protein
MSNKIPVIKEACNPGHYLSTRQAIANTIDGLADEISKHYPDIVELYENDDEFLYFMMVKEPYEDELDEFIETIYKIGAFITKKYGESTIKITIVEQGIDNYQYYGEMQLTWLR